MNHLYAGQHSWSGTWLTHTWDINHSYVGNDSFICGTWLIHMQYNTHERANFEQVSQESPKFETNFHRSKRESPSLPWTNRNPVESGEPNISSLISFDFHPGPHPKPHPRSQAHPRLHTNIGTLSHTHAHTRTHTHTHTQAMSDRKTGKADGMGWLRLVGSLKL